MWAARTAFAFRPVFITPSPNGKIITISMISTITHGPTGDRLAAGTAGLPEWWQAKAGDCHIFPAR